MMGFEFNTLDFEREFIGKTSMYSGLLWCELGNQRINNKIPLKKRYLELGVAEHLSLDINGHDGSMQVNLDKPIPDWLEGRFDVVSNYGTSDHINNQEQCFRNIHKLCKIGGLMAHVVPLNGNWVNHGRFYYEMVFFTNLAKLNNYEIISSYILGDSKFKQIYVCFRKKQNDFVFSGIGVEDSGVLDYTGDYASFPWNLINHIKKYAYDLKDNPLALFTPWFILFILINFSISVMYPENRCYNEVLFKDSNLLTSHDCLHDTNCLTFINSCDKNSRQIFFFKSKSPEFIASSVSLIILPFYIKWRIL